MMFFLFLLQVYAQSPDVVFQNNHAVEMQKQDRHMEAKQILLNQVVENPSVAPLKYNLGIVLEKMTDIESAIQEYLAAAKNSDDTNLQFQALFNAARIYGEKKDISNALKYYQLALDIKPDSIEVKTNIEMLSQTGGGGGKGQNDESKDSSGENSEQKNTEQKNKDSEGNKKQEQKKQQPKPFKSQDLSEQDVKRILDELKQQENQIRKKMNEQKSQESPIGKDW